MSASVILPGRLAKIMLLEQHAAALILQNTVMAMEIA
jgi:hypothetical protein